MQRIAQDWLVLTELTDDDATAVGITMALQFGPQLLLLPLTGLVADRFDRRTGAHHHAGRHGACSVSGSASSRLSGVVELWMVFAFALGLGVAAAFDAPARQAFVGELVPTTHLGNAVALNSASFNGARLIGPAVAGLLVAAVGAGWVFLINAVTFAAVLVALGAAAARRVHSASPRAAAGAGPDPRRASATCAGGPTSCSSSSMIFLIGTFGFNFPIYIATMARVEFGQGAGVFGVLSSVHRDRLGRRRAARRASRAAAAAHGHPRRRAVRGEPRRRARSCPTLWIFGVALVARRLRRAHDDDHRERLRADHDRARRCAAA